MENSKTTAREMTAPRAKRELRGGTVLAMFVAFFAVVGTVNAIMVRAATSTFGGVETGGAYKAGLDFKNEIAALHAQEARHWAVAGTVTRDPAGMMKLDLRIADAQGRLPSAITANIRLAHPTNARLDRSISVAAVGGNHFAGETSGPAGQWDLVIDLFQSGERVFRSKSRIVLR
jgi:nitrogen fixation protein FixH